ncbi:SMP-30/gluconolactonase/LRE family protein [Mesobacterium pallidum]|uniref:SMP-30/gluconolactonase/LRE family protein n=1 Tax=Mesobacterium pallidum TaxID=2872037 RepID=UPI001EE33CAF|nr:SMP-30/gluconolactonase/LRE family protein [Mesobacterium pallidum]
MQDKGLTAEAAMFRPLSDKGAKLGESPVWSARDGAVWWVDIDGRQLLRTRMDGSTDAWQTSETPGFVQILGDDVVLGMESGLFRFAPDAGFARIAELAAKGQRFNDACLDAQGRLWAGTMDREARRDDGVLYLYEAGGQLRPVLDGFRIINGLAWDDTRQRLYLSDSHPEVQTVWTCSVGPEGKPGNRATFAAFHDLKGRPDGALVDPGGAYWIAGVGGAQIYRYAPDGRLMATYDVPVAAPTKPALSPGGMVLTSKHDAQGLGRLHLWASPPV